MPKYKLGCCIPGASFMPEGKASIDDRTLDEIRYGCSVIINAGFDYAEIGVGMVMKLSDADFETLVSENLPIKAANSFIPFHYKIVADGACDADGTLYQYVDKAFYRMSRLGIYTVVFGSGGARRIPDGMTKAEGHEYIKTFLRMCGEIGEKYGVTTAIEPLRLVECNAINYTEEGERLADEVFHPYVKYLADAFHMCHGNEPCDRLNHAKTLPCHIHVSEAPDRTYPGSVNGVYLAKFAEELKKTAYDGMVSVECGFSDFTSEIALAYDFVKVHF